MKLDEHKIEKQELKEECHRVSIQWHS